jgi:hypothetical protein
MADRLKVLDEIRNFVAELPQSLSRPEEAAQGELK